MIEIRNVSKTFYTKNKPVQVLDNVSMTVESGGFVAIVGPSGCGKSTLLNLIAGLIPSDPGGGMVLCQGKEVNNINTTAGYMTQKDTLLPWRTVENNVAVPCEIRRLSVEVKHQKITALLKKLGLSGFEQHYPQEISGGMRRRALLARTLIYDPTILLMDEPLGALDALLKLVIQEELLKIWEEKKLTVLYVTHDLSEAICLADRVAVFSSRPARLKMLKEVDFPRPRDISKIRQTSRFTELYNSLWEALRDEVINQEEMS